MSTKAERFRYQAEREGPKRPKAPARPPRNAPVDTALPGVSATDRKVAQRHPSSRVDRKAAYVLEDSATKPSRKSTRRASNRQKTDSQMRVKRQMSEGRPAPRVRGP